MRRNRKFKLGDLRNKINFYRVDSVSGPNGSSYEYTLVNTDFFKKETQIQNSTYAESGGANISNQDCIFFGRYNPNFWPTKGMVCFNEVDGFWYNVLSPQPLEDPTQFWRFLATRKEPSFAPVITT